MLAGQRGASGVRLGQRCGRRGCQWHEGRRWLRRCKSIGQAGRLQPHHAPGETQSLLCFALPAQCPALQRRHLLIDLLSFPPVLPSALQSCMITRPRTVSCMSVDRDPELNSSVSKEVLQSALGKALSIFHSTPRIATELKCPQSSTSMVAISLRTFC